VRRAPRLHRRSGLRPDRDEPGHPRGPGRDGREPAGLDRAGDPEHRVPRRGCRDRGGRRAGRGRGGRSGSAGRR
jgi:hypothetical protein